MICLCYKQQATNTGFIMNTIPQHLRYLQEEFFPYVEENLGPYTDKHKQLCQIIAFARPEQFLSSCKGLVGRPYQDRASIARSFIAKAVYNLPTTRALIDRLHCDPVTRRICGFERSDRLPSEATFSRVFDEFARTDFVSLLQDEFIKRFHSGSLFEYVSRDSTAISAREKTATKTTNKDMNINTGTSTDQYTNQPVKAPKKTGRPKKGEIREPKELSRLKKQTTMSLEAMLADLPKSCDNGCKKNSKGYTESWRGYKLHIDSADGDMPISAILTSASVHDSQVALPLTKITSGKIHHLYELMDSAYDADIIRTEIADSGKVPVIDFNHRSPKDQREFDQCKKERYKNRSSAERVNGNLKDNFGGCMVRVKGAAKVFTHLMFGLLALAINQTLRPHTATTSAATVT